jgi:hypothetical protein
MVKGNYFQTLFRQADVAFDPFRQLQARAAGSASRGRCGAVYVSA